MECKDILNLIAIIVIPIVAVLIGQHLQNRAEIRKDKMHIFKVLMTSRIYGWTQESVHCLNIISLLHQALVWRYPNSALFAARFVAGTSRRIGSQR